MANWLKIARPNVEMSNGFLLYQSLIINLDAATAFAIQNAGTVSVFIEGKAIVVQQQFDDKAYQTVLKYAQARTGQSLT
jgi:hypothetical protein